MISINTGIEVCNQVHKDQTDDTGCSFNPNEIVTEVFTVSSLSFSLIAFPSATEVVGR